MFNEIEHVARNEYHRFVSDLFKPMPTKVESILHAAVGMSGEVAELYEGILNVPDDIMPRESENIWEELGDLRFYMVSAMLELGLTEVWVKEQDVCTEFDDPEGIFTLGIYTGRFLDIVKKCWAYKKPLEAVKGDMEQALLQVFQAYKRTCDFLDLHDDFIRIQNVTKLSKRYPLGKYSDADALARADKTVTFTPPSNLHERVGAALEKGVQGDKVHPQPLFGQLTELHGWFHGHNQLDNSTVEELLTSVNEGLVA